MAPLSHKTVDHLLARRQREGEVLDEKSDFWPAEPDHVSRKVEIFTTTDESETDKSV